MVRKLLYAVLPALVASHMGISSPQSMDQVKIGDDYRAPVVAGTSPNAGGVCHGASTGGAKVASGTVELTMSFGAAHDGGPCGAYICSAKPALPSCMRQTLPVMPGCTLIHTMKDCTLGKSMIVPGVGGTGLLVWVWNPVSSGQCEIYMNCWELAGGGAVGGAPTAAKPPTPALAPTQAQECQKYTVVSGDYMIKIAADKGTTLELLMAANPQIISANDLQVGQVLNIPPCTSATPPSPAATGGTKSCTCNEKKVACQTACLAQTNGVSSNQCYSSPPFSTCDCGQGVIIAQPGGCTEVCEGNKCTQLGEPVASCTGGCGTGTCTGGKCYCINGFTGNSCEVAPAATCMDGLKNQDEIAVDCGGTKCKACPTYTWKFTEWSKCSATCGGGQQTRTAECQDNTGVVVDKAKCAVHDISLSIPCNQDACPTYSWVKGEVSSCSKPCGEGETTQRHLCVSSMGGSVADSMCKTAKPADITTPCNTQACLTSVWETSAWSACSLNCGRGTQTRNVTCAMVANAQCEGVKPNQTQPCNTESCTDAYKWFPCAWETCTSTCGGMSGGMLSMQYRTILCKDAYGNILDPSRCPNATKPTNSVDGCNPQPCNTYNWMADGPWSACVGGMRSNSYHCHDATGGNAAKEDCLKYIGAMPSLTQPCSLSSCPAIVTTNVCQRHIVKKNQNVTDIAMAWDITVEALLAHNKLTVPKDANKDTVLTEGSHVLIPGDCLGALAENPASAGSMLYGGMLGLLMPMMAVAFVY